MISSPDPFVSLTAKSPASPVAVPPVLEPASGPLPRARLSLDSTAPVHPRAVRPATGLVGAQWDKLLGTEIERFRIETRLYADATRGTFAGVHTRLHFRVIVRALNLDAATPVPALVDLLSQQARSTAHLHHTNITRILTCTLHERFLIIVSEFAAGVTLAERLARTSTFAEEEVVTIAQQAAAGLQAGLQHGLLHHGICPMHLRVTTPLKVKLADYCWHIPQDLFSIPPQAGSPVKPDRVAQALLPYRAPEHLLGRDLDHRADIYALGATLYHLLAGRPCFEASTVDALLTAQQRTPPLALSSVNPAVSPGTSTLVMAMIAPERSSRPPDYRTLLSRLESCMLGARLHQARTSMKDSQIFYRPTPSA